MQRNNYYRPLYATLLLFVLTHAAQGQSFPLCGAEWLHQRSLSDSTSRQTHEMLEQEALEHFKTHPGTAQRGGAVVTIPVVVHLVHNNGPENLSDTRVQQALQTLNEAFANSGLFFQGSGTDVPIRFCLAQRQPDGSATTGVTRTVSPLTKLQVETRDAALKNLVRWNPLDYLNIWVVEELCSSVYGCGLTAYAYRPNNHGNGVDGIVIEARWLDSDPAYISILAHEIGHYFGLYHTFEGGCGNADCLSDGDRVCDTPPEQSSVAIPCGQTVNTCSTDVLSGFSSDQPDPTQNFMDYGDYQCIHDFTAGQAARMRFFLEGARSSLLDSRGCQAPCPAPVVAAFSPGDTTVVAGTTLVFANQSQNSAGISWLLNGAPLAGPSYTFSEQGLYTLTLVATAANTALCDPARTSAVVRVVCSAQADFTLSTEVAAVGQTVVIVDRTQNATQTEWFVNNVSQGGQLGSFTPTATGSYQIRLEVANSSCRSVQTKYIVVRDSCASSQFVKRYQWDRNERGVAAQALANGEVLLVGESRVGVQSSIFCIKTAADGQPLWSRLSSEQGSVSYAVRDMVPAPDGGFVLAVTATEVGKTTGDVALLKYDASGEQVWAFQLMRSATDEAAAALCALPGGGYAVCSSANNPAPGASWSAAIAVVSEAGTLVWNRAFDATGQYFAIDIAEKNGQLFVVANRTLATQNAAAVFCVDRSTGNVLWGTRLNVNINDQCAAVTVLPNGSVAVAGQTIGPSPSQKIPWIAVLNPATGALVSAKNVPGPAGGNAFTIRDLALSVSNDLLVGGIDEGSENTYRIHMGADLDKGTAIQYEGSIRVFNKMNLLPNGGCLIAGNRPNDSALNTDAGLIQTDALGYAGPCSSLPIPVALSPALLTASALDFTVVELGTLTALNLPLQVFFPEVGAACARDQCATNTLDDCQRSAWNFAYGLGLITNTTAPANPIPAFAQLPNGDFILATNRNSKTQLVRTNAQGKVVWARQIDEVSASGVISPIVVALPNGHFVVVTRSANLLEIDKDGNILKNKQLSISSDATLDRLISAKNGDLIGTTSVASGTNVLVTLFRLDLNAQLHQGFSWTAEGMESAEATQELDNGDILVTTGLNRIAVFRANRNGQFIWGKKQNLALSEKAVIYGLAETADSDIVLGGHRPLSNQSSTPQLVKLDASGNLIWSKLYPPNTGVLKSCTPAADGSLLMVNASSATTDNGSIFKVDASGKAEWDFFSELLYYKGLATVDGGFAYLGTPASSEPWELALSKTDKSGLPQTCNGDFLDTETTDAPLVLEPWDPGMSSYFFASTEQPIPSSAPLLHERSTICPVECDGAVENCDNLTDDDGDKLIDCIDEDCPCAEDACATKRANLWFFGQQWGLDFSTDPPVFVKEGRTYTIGGSSVATDARGNLLAYADASMLFDRYHTPLQKSSKVPVFNNNNDVLLWPILRNKRFFDCYTQNAFGILGQYRIALQGNEGKGTYEYRADVIQGWSGQMCAFPSCDTTAYWLIGAGKDSPPFDFTLLSVRIDSLLYVKRGSVTLPDQALLELKAAPSGKQVAVLDITGRLTLFDFNQSTGAFENQQLLLSPLPGQPLRAGIEFSSDGRFLYALVQNQADQHLLLQYDLLAGTTAQINASATAVGTFDNTIPHKLQLGPDKKIYISSQAQQLNSTANSHWLAVIHRPKLPGTACFLQNRVILLPNGDYPEAEFGLPQFPAHYFKEPLLRFRQPAADTICQTGQIVSYQVAHNECSDQDIRWTLEGLQGEITALGDTALVRYASAGQGRLIATQTTACGTVADTLQILVLSVAPPKLDLGPDRVLCDGGVAVLDAGPGFVSYRWQDGTSDPTITTLLPGRYAMTATDACGQVQIDFVKITFSQQQPLQLGPNRRQCPGDTARFVRPAGLSRWRWSPETFLDCADCPTVKTTVENSTTYIVVGQTPEGCVSTDTLAVEVLPQALARVDTTLCPGTAFRFLNTDIPAGQQRSFTLTAANGCDSVVVVNVGAFPPLRVFLPADTFLYYGDTLPLRALIDGVGPFDWTWSPPTGLSCTDCTDPLATPLVNILYRIRVTDDNNCVSADSIGIEIVTKCDNVIPNAFTPNGDELNDWFYPISLPCTRKMLRWRVFNRWGQLVFERENFASNNPVLGWDGRYKGIEQPMDVYLWYAEWLRFDGKVENGKGAVTLLR